MSRKGTHRGKNEGLTDELPPLGPSSSRRENGNGVGRGADTTEKKGQSQTRSLSQSSRRSSSSRSSSTNGGVAAADNGNGSVFSNTTIGSDSPTFAPASVGSDQQNGSGKRIVVVKKKRSSSNLAQSTASANAGPSSSVGAVETPSSARRQRRRGGAHERESEEDEDESVGENSERRHHTTKKKPTTAAAAANVAVTEFDDPLAATLGSSGSAASSNVEANPTIPSRAERAKAIENAVHDIISLDDVCFKIVLIGDSGVGKSAVTFRFCDNVFFEEGAPTLGVDFKYARIETAEPVPRTARLQIWDTAGQEAFLTLTTGFYRSAAGIVLCFDITNRMSFLHLDLWMQRIRDNCMGRSDGQIPPIILVGCKLDLARYDPFAFSSPASSEGAGADGEVKKRAKGRGHVHTSSTASGDGNGSVFASEIRKAQTTGDFVTGVNVCHRQVSQAEALAWCEANNILCYFETSAKENAFVMDAFRHITTHIVKNTKMDTIVKGSSGGKKGKGGGGGTSGGIYLRPKGANAHANDKGDGDKPRRKGCRC